METFNPNKKRYCSTCGGTLRVETIARYYNVRTGEPYHHYRFTCPRWTWLKPWQSHARWCCDEDGSTYAYEA